MASGFLRWKNHVDKLLRFNHMTMTLAAESFDVKVLGSQRRRDTGKANKVGNKKEFQYFAFKSRRATGTIQYNFDSTADFPSPFLRDSPRFNMSFEPSLRHFPCLVILHGNSPGGFDVARWMAGGITHAHRLRNPLMPTKYGTYSAFNLQERGPVPPLGLLSLSRPGYLESSPLHLPCFLSQAAVVAQLVENLRVPSVHVIAHQNAAPIALELAALPKFKHRVKSISLVDPVLSPPSKSTRISQRLSLVGPEWARTRAAYNALARSSSDPYFRKVISDICGSASVQEIEDDSALSALYEGIGVFFAHWNSRKLGVLADLMMWDSFDRKSWSLVSSPIMCLDLEKGPADIADSARAQTNRAALVNIRSTPEFVTIGGSGEMLFPLGKVSDLCLDFIHKNN